MLMMLTNTVQRPNQQQQQQRYMQWLGQQGTTKAPPQSLDAMLSENAWSNAGTPTGMLSPGTYEAGST